ncbi:hypothetical protein [Azospirillum thermophilum]|uniref:CN hydrolase domain-containing protein n=1 Tax=Azospirillum thermophilum TaxID=2202148 RepID=A0A2S2CZY7_9PROT|nr:hypothetical protein [Azospirillum thermophilum]AWK90073.1 hypothetical protein DEW08_29250 [Azospirillum thermophilum]
MHPSPAPPSPADLFIALLKRLEADPDATRRAAERHEADPPAVRRPARHLDLLLREAGTAGLLAWIRQEQDGLPEVERVLLAAQAIDRWYAPFAAVHDPAGPPAPDHLLVRRRFNRHGRLNGDPADGQLIVRHGYLGRRMAVGEAAEPGEFDAADLFRTLFLVPPRVPAGTAHDDSCRRMIDVRFTRRREPADRNPFDPDWAPAVAVVPLAQAEEDIAIRQFRRDGTDWYDPVPRDLGARAAGAIRALAGDGATFVIFPEVALHPDALGAVKQALRAQAVDGPIRYVLAGTRQPAPDGGKPFNRAVLLDRTGAEVVVQTKLHCWDLDSDQCRSYDLRSPDGRVLGGVNEFIAPGGRLELVELPNLGRLAVMICEDLDRSQPGDWLRRSMLLDWVVTPVLDSGLTTGRWQAREGAATSQSGSCRVVVANSMTFSHRFNRAARGGGHDRDVIADCGVALFFQPRRSQQGRPRVRLLTLPLDAPDGSRVCARWQPADWDELPEPKP